ncbi:hypothetical protein, partial [Paenibacillus sp. FSL H7-0331]
RLLIVYVFAWKPTNFLNNFSSTYIDADAEAFWKSNPTLWNKYRPIGNALMEEKFNEQTIISYNGSTVTLVNNDKEYTVTFASMKSIEDTFLTSDPLGDYNWSESIKSAIRHENVKLYRAVDLQRK